MPTEFTLQSRGLTLAGKAWGPEDAPVCLALHGWLDNASTYDRLAPLLPQWRIVALDMPGHGLSDHRSEDGDYHFVDWVGDVMGAVASLGLDRFTLMGHSMGAGVGCMVAGAYPDRVERLVLLDGLGPLSAEPESIVARLAAHLAENERLRCKVGPRYRSRDDVAVRLAKVVPRLSPAGARILVERGTKEVPGGVTWRTDPRLRGTSAIPMSEAQVLAFLRAIACPTLVVRPRDGYPFDATQLQGRLAALQRGSLVTLASGGHHAHLETPEVVGSAVRDFLTRTKPTSPPASHPPRPALQESALI